MAVKTSDVVEQILSNQRSIMRAIVFMRTGREPAEMLAFDREEPMNDLVRRIAETDKMMFEAAR